MSTTDNRIQVAILGGGLGGMTAAYYLSCTPELRARYAVTVHQQGWRLGGKAASGRDRERGDRIYEHGLHMLMGFYDNLFATMRRVYAEWPKEPENPFQSWRDAFHPRSQVTLQDDLGGGRWETWNVLLPPRPGLPGDPPDAPIDVLDYLERLLEWMLESIQRAVGDQLRDFVDHPTSWSAGLIQRLTQIAHAVVMPAQLVTDWLPESVRTLWRLLEGIVRPDDVETGDALQHASTLLGEVEGWLERVFSALELDDELRRLRLALLLGMAIARGLVTDVLPYGRQGFERINNEDFKDWLARHGARGEDVYFGAPVRALYDLAFAWLDGRSTGSIDQAQLAAGAGLYAFLKMGLGYRGAPLWDMAAGMGDTIFSPLYEVCRLNGVRFEFFSRVTHLGLSQTGNSIERIELWRQAEVKPDPVTGAREYRPLYTVRGLPCWPSEPDWSQLVDGARLKAEGVDFESAWCNEHVETRTLEHGRDFDLVVLAIPPGALPLFGGELIARHEAWREMVEQVPTVATLAVQLWLEPTLEELGWRAGPTTMTSYVHPIESWGEMSHLLAREDWPADKPVPRSVEYFCGSLEGAAVLPAPGNESYPQDERDRVASIARDWFSKYIGHLWPRATQPSDPGALDWQHLIDWQERTGEARFDFQYWRANVEPSERYVLTPPGSVRFRLRADRSGLYNLFLAGDWVVTAINGGSAEAACQGGMLAARAICGVPEMIYDDPYEGS